MVKRKAFNFLIISISKSFSKFQLYIMSDSSLSSSETSLSSSDSLDSFSNFDKLKPYNFEPTISDNETEKSVPQLCKQR